MMKIVVMLVTVLLLAACSGGSSMEKSTHLPTHSFRASGGGVDSQDRETFWLVDIDFEKGLIELAVTGKEEDKALVMLLHAIQFPDQDLVSYEAIGLNRRDSIVVKVYREECVDNTGIKRPFRVFITHDKRFREYQNIPQGMVFNGCGQYNGVGELTRIWQLIEIDGRKISPVGENSSLPAIEFLLWSGSMRGDGGCNRFYGKTKISNDSIEIGDIATTRIACPDMSIESTYVEILSGRRHAVTIGEGEMTLTSERGVLTFRGR